MSLSIQTVSKNTYKTIDEDYPYEQDLTSINSLLQKEGAQQFVETSSKEASESRCAYSSFPEVFYAILCRLVAYGYAGISELPPLQDGDSIYEDEILEEEMYMLRSHIISHSDSEGYFVPTEFAEPIIDDLARGGAVCSSYAAIKELIGCASLIGINLDGNFVSDDEANNINSTPQEHPYFAERIAWFTLYEAMRISIQSNSLVVFL